MINMQEVSDKLEKQLRIEKGSKDKKSASPNGRQQITNAARDNQSTPANAMQIPKEVKDNRSAPLNRQPSQKESDTKKWTLVNVQPIDKEARDNKSASSKTKEIPKETHDNQPTLTTLLQQQLTFRKSPSDAGNTTQISDQRPKIRPQTASSSKEQSVSSIDVVDEKEYGPENYVNPAVQEHLRAYARQGRRFTELNDHTWIYVNEANRPSEPSVADNDEIILAPPTNGSSDIDSMDSKVNIRGFGNVPIPSHSYIAKALGPDRSLTLTALSWNINDKNVKILKHITDHIYKLKEPIADILSIAIQEIPPSSTNFHEDVLALLQSAVASTHDIFVSNRSWSQMLLIFIKREHILYATEPCVKFVASAAIPKPMRTKGGIGICFRIYQRFVVIIGCHLSHASRQQRCQDYHKLVQNMKFSTLRQFTGRGDNLLAADIVIWSGDLNFRLDKDLEIDWNSNQERFSEDIKRAMTYDGLNSVRSQATAFLEFDEPPVTFAPTHKLELDSESYVPKRIPSWTDRVLYRQRQADWVTPIHYKSIPGPTQSDHRPVYCTMKINVITKPIPEQFYKNNGQNEGPNGPNKIITQQPI